MGWCTQADRFISETEQHLFISVTMFVFIGHFSKPDCLILKSDALTNQVVLMVKIRLKRLR